jgi:hypothetical protein
VAKDALGEVFTERHGGRVVQVRQMSVAPGAIEEIAAEARAAMTLSHVAILQPIEVNAVGGLVTVVTEALDGRTLRGLLSTLATTGEKLPVSHATWIAIKLLEVLDVAQAHKQAGKAAPLFHGRLSPEHVFLTPGGELRVLGWGLDAACRHLLKPSAKTDPAFAYLSPEQVAGGAPNPASDNFAVGAILVEALLGKPLFLEDTFAHTFEAINERDVPIVRESRDNVPKALDEVLAWALDRVTDRRAPRPEGLLRRLEAFQGMLDVGDRIKSNEHPRRLGDLMRLRMKASGAGDVIAMGMPKSGAGAPKRRRVLVALRLLLLTLLGTLGYGVWRSWRELEPKVRARIPAPIAAQLGIDQDVVLAAADAGFEPVDAGALAAGVADAGTSARRPALLWVDSTPKATVVIDGKTLGVTPLANVEVDAGNHTVLLVSKKPRLELSQTITVAEGETKKLSVKLKHK